MIAWLEVNGWICAVCLIMAVVYWHGHLHLYDEKSRYADRREKLLSDKAILVSRQRTLQIYLENNNNPEWIEWHLMSRLGMTPKGATKLLLKIEQDRHDKPR